MVQNISQTKFEYDYWINSSATSVAKEKALQQESVRDAIVTFPRTRFIYEQIHASPLKRRVQLNCKEGQSPH